MGPVANKVFMLAFGNVVSEETTAEGLLKSIVMVS